VEHRIVFAEYGRFAGWPANNGVWKWSRTDETGGDEILVGFTTGAYVVHSGHNIDKPYANQLARSLDGGLTWQVESPEGYRWSGNPLQHLPVPLDFTRPGFAMRVIGDAYHGSEEKRGGFVISDDRGKSWHGPFEFAGLSCSPELEDVELTPRTDYLVTGPVEGLVFLSARSHALWGADRTFCARTTDGGLSFNFVSWLVPPSDPYRAVMPSTVRCTSHKFVSALRRRDMDAGDQDCWVDAYVSQDAGESWSFLCKIGVTGQHNGNPPALVRLTDGRLCCVYGQRNTRQMIARYSEDEGVSWEQAIVLRDDYASVEQDQDLGYPRLVQRSDGYLVAIYYWATADRPHQHIAATIWDPTVEI
jgi:hypothetical protein